MVEELLPASITRMAEVDVDQWIVFWAMRFLYESKSGLFGHSPALSDVAVRARTNDVFPDRFSADASGDNVVKRQLGGWILLAAILAFVFIAGENISPVKLDLISRQTVIKEQPNYSRHGYIEIDGGHPVVSVRLEPPPQLADLSPALEIVVRINSLFKRHNLRQLPEKQGKRPSCLNNAYRHIVLVENKHVAVQTRLYFRGNHCLSV